MSHRSALSDLDKTFLWKWLLDSKWAKKAAIIFVCWNGFCQLLLKTTLKEKKEKKLEQSPALALWSKILINQGYLKTAQYRT